MSDILNALSTVEEGLLEARLPMPTRLEVTHEVLEHLRREYAAEDDRRSRMLRFVGLDIVVEDDVPPPGWRFVWPEGHEPEPMLVVRSLHLDLPEGMVGYLVGNDILIATDGAVLPEVHPTGRALKEVNIGDPEVSERIRAILDEAMAKTDPWRYPPSMSLFSPERWDRITGAEGLTPEEHRRLYEGTWPSEEGP